MCILYSNFLFSNTNDVTHFLITSHNHSLKETELKSHRIVNIAHRYFDSSIADR